MISRCSAGLLTVSLQDFLSLPRFLFPFSGNHVSACLRILLLAVLCTCPSLDLLNMTSTVSKHVGYCVWSPHFVFCFQFAPIIRRCHCDDRKIALIILFQLVCLTGESLVPEQADEVEAHKRCPAGAWQGDRTAQTSQSGTSATAFELSPLRLCYSQVHQFNRWETATRVTSWVHIRQQTLTGERSEIFLVRGGGGIFDRSLRWPHAVSHLKCSAVKKLNVIKQSYKSQLHPA